MSKRTLSMLAERHPLAAPAAQRARLSAVDVDDFDAVAGPVAAGAVRVLQLNLGKVCNQACRHCHVDAGPDRTEVMSDAVVDRCLALIERGGVGVVDLTGGAPELHPRFREIVARAAGAGAQVMDRCNLTILTTSKYSELPEFFAAHGVEVVSSLPAADAARTDAQRGDGVFERSMTAMRMLNAAGYGVDPAHVLTLVANPVGAFLPPSQASWEREYRAQLASREGVSFTRLIALTNMPIARYLEWLDESGNTERYLQKLRTAFNPATLAGIMCRDTLSVAYDGALYDCDFNQMLELKLAGARTIFDVDDLAALAGRTVATARHCFGCTAGAGSSCGGQVA